MARQDPRIQLAKDLFAAWSSGEVDAPAAYLADDCELVDIIHGRFKGWSVIRPFFAEALKRWPDLKFVLEQFWTSDDGVAVTWDMSATVIDDSFGPDAKGKVWHSLGMSSLVIRDGKVLKEVDYYDRVNRPLSVGAEFEG